VTERTDWKSVTVTAAAAARRAGGCGTELRNIAAGDSEHPRTGEHLRYYTAKGCQIVPYGF